MFDSTTVVSVRIQRPLSILRSHAWSTSALFIASHVSGRIDAMFACSADLFGGAADGDRRQKPRSTSESPN